MKVLLLKDVPDRGKRGDVIDVAEGFARNFLYPQHLAVQATEKTVGKRDTEATQVKKRESKIMKAAAALAAKLEGRECVVKAKVNEQGTLYAAVTAKQICAILRKEKLDIDESMIHLPEPIKELGEREVTIDLPHGFEARITVRVES